MGLSRSIFATIADSYGPHCKHSNGRMNWQLDPAVVKDLRIKLIWGTAAIVVLALAIVITDALGHGPA